MNTMTYSSFIHGAAEGDSVRLSRNNVGGMDRLFRVGLAGVLIADALHGTGPLGLESVFIIAAIPLVVTAIIAWDPIYALFKIRTATLRQDKPPSGNSAYRMNANGGINIGAIDRVSRVILASVLLATPFLWAETIGLPAFSAMVAGIMLMMTAVMGWDPVYQLAKVRTATLPIETSPPPSKTKPVDSFELFDEVAGNDADILQQAA